MKAGHGDGAEDVIDRAAESGQPGTATDSFRSSLSGICAPVMTTGSESSAWARQRGLTAEVLEQERERRGGVAASQRCRGGQTHAMVSVPCRMTKPSNRCPPQRLSGGVGSPRNCARSSWPCGSSRSGRRCRSSRSTDRTRGSSLHVSGARCKRRTANAPAQMVLRRDETRQLLSTRLRLDWQRP